MNLVKTGLLLCFSCSWVVLALSNDCQDLDTQACVLMHQSNPRLCEEPALSETACPRYCNFCPPTCYHCDASVQNFTHCQTTQECSIGETCMLRELTSTIDGHHEYAMHCAPAELCDGIGSAYEFVGRRSISERNIAVSCCSTDLCNIPLSLASTVPTTATTSSTKAPTTSTLQITVCSRDIVIVVEDAVTGAAENTDAYMKSFLKELVSSMTIGPDDNLVEMALLDSGMHKLWNLKDQENSHDLLHAIDNINFQHNTDNIDIDNLYKFVSHEAFTRRHGDRDSVPNDFVLFVDYRAVPEHYDLEKVLLSDVDNLFGDIIVVNIGGTGTGFSLVDALATSPQHILSVAEYSQLSSIKRNLLALLCD